jgi:hypothetical protein
MLPVNTAVRRTNFSFLQYNSLSPKYLMERMGRKRTNSLKQKVLSNGEQSQ